jgi:hypothetical protein
MDADRLFDTLLDEAQQYVVTDGDLCHVYDPYFDLKRCRVTAEVCKAMLRAGRGSETTDGMIRWLASRQNPDGSWNELHPRYSRPSALATAFGGEAFLLEKAASGLTGEQEARLKKAARYVRGAETAPGRFRKSEKYLSDYLNVDASCGAFLARYGHDCGDAASLEAATRAALNCVAFQAPDGAYPYTTAEGGAPERYPLDMHLMAELRQRGFEVGVHGLRHDGKLFDLRSGFMQRAKSINGYLQAWNAKGFRAELMHRQPEWMQALDIDRDGELSATEIANASTALGTLDKNGDGKVSREELGPPPPPPPAPQSQPSPTAE